MQRGFALGLTLSELATTHQRTQNEILARLGKLKLIHNAGGIIYKITPWADVRKKYPARAVRGGPAI